jgi:hypothetical protein
MVSAVDRGDKLLLLPIDFTRALEWLREVEAFMPDVFTAGSFSVDARAMDEICDFVARQGKPVTSGAIFRFASNILPAYALDNVLKVMLISGRLKQVGQNPMMYESGN